MSVNRTVKIDAFPGSAFRYLDREAVVCIDVISTTTTIVTAAALGRTVYPAVGLADARSVARRLENPLIAVEEYDPRIEGVVRNSAVEIAARSDVSRPLVLDGATGTQLLLNAAGASAAYAACLRNVSATADHLAREHGRIALLGAGWGSDFRCEDQIAAARIAARLVGAHGFACEDAFTADVVARWGDGDLTLVSLGRSVSWLRRTGHLHELEFVLAHVDDLQVVCPFREGAIRAVETPRPAAAEGSQEVAVATGAGRVLRFRPEQSPASGVLRARVSPDVAR